MLKCQSLLHYLVGHVVMDTGSDKTKILVNSIKPRPSPNIMMNGKTLEEMGQFKYLESTQTKDRSENQTGVHTLSLDKVTCLANTAQSINL